MEPTLERWILSAAFWVIFDSRLDRDRPLPGLCGPRPSRSSRRNPSSAGATSAWGVSAAAADCGPGVRAAAARCGSKLHSRRRRLSAAAQPAPGDDVVLLLVGRQLRRRRGRIGDLDLGVASADARRCWQHRSRQRRRHCHSRRRRRHVG